MRHDATKCRIWATLLVTCGLLGCKHDSPTITAVSLTNPCEPAGIPFYLPKPLLIVSKNFRNIETEKPGLTDTAPIPEQFDDQSKYADLNARTNFVGLNPTPADGGTQNTTVNGPQTSGGAQKSGQHLFSQNGAPITPATAPVDGLSPRTFYTYQIVFVPDLSQKYGLQIKGGAGEIRAAMNLVNGWQFTGLGPYYMKDSSTAQDILAAGISTRLGGQAVADVLKGVADLTGAAGGLQSQVVPGDSPAVQTMSTALESLPKDCVPMTIANFAEIHVFEASLGYDGQMVWNEIASLCFDREYLGLEKAQVTTATQPTGPSGTTQSGAASPEGQLQSTIVGSDPSAQLARSAVASVLGIPLDSQALQPLPSGQPQSATVGGGVPGVVQMQVDCDDDECAPREHNFIKIEDGHHKSWLHHEQRRGKIQSQQLRLPQYITPPQFPSPQQQPTNPFDQGLTDPDEEAAAASGGGTPESPPEEPPTNPPPDPNP